jgi:hypothetical protein
VKYRSANPSIITHATSYKLNFTNLDMLFLTTSSITAGISSDFLNTSTISILSEISAILGYAFFPRTSVMVGFTGITL